MTGILVKFAINWIVVQRINLRLAIVKPLGATWLIVLMDYLVTPRVCLNGFCKAGLVW